jgi:hypothetical protein
MALDTWDSNDERSQRFGPFERVFWLVAARVLIPVNGLIVGYLIGQAF